MTSFDWMKERKKGSKLLVILPSFLFRKNIIFKERGFAVGFRNFIVLGTSTSSDYIPDLGVSQGTILPGLKPEIDIFDLLMSASNDVIELILSILDFIVNNPELLFLLASGFVGVGIGVFQILKKKAR